MTQTLTELSHHSQTWRIAVSKLQPLINLIEDDTVSEILLSNYKNTRVDRQGVLENIEGVAFASDEALFEAVQQIAKSLNQDYDRNAYPILDGRLPNGYRIHSIAYPYAVPPYVRLVVASNFYKIRGFDDK
jgi:Flp pilus assembly CpaF family ATPase